MSSTEVIVLCLAVSVLIAIGAYVFRIARAQADPKVGTGLDDPNRQAPATCSETCDIHDKLGESVTYDCGHDDAPEFRLDLYGEPCIHKKPGLRKKACSDCLLAGIMQIARRCGACGFVIMPGDPVALCIDDRKIGKQEWKTLVGDQLLVCLRYDCDNGPGYCGHWTGDAIEPAYADGGNMISQVFKSGEPMLTVIGPLSDAKPPSK
jgi:hypothetical protein